MFRDIQSRLQVLNVQFHHTVRCLYELLCVRVYVTQISVTSFTYTFQISSLSVYAFHLVHMLCIPVISIYKMRLTFN
jgi:hypothetical protein